MRKIINLNREWKFTHGDVSNAQAIDFCDKQWQDIGLPHSFSIPYFGALDFYVGYGWYRKSISIDEMILKNKNRVILQFDGVFQVLEIFINGKAARTHSGGYTGFYFDITDCLEPGENLLALRVNNLWNPQIAPRAGEHFFSGGIYRDVSLIIYDEVHIDWYGTYITCPEISKESAVVSIKTQLNNHSKKAIQITLKTTIVDSDGNTVTVLENQYDLTQNSVAQVEQLSKRIENPHLWHPDTPYLYKAISSLLIDDKPIDEYVTTFGMRWFKFTAEQGFFINGEHLYLKGANAHQDHAGWGDAVTLSGMERDVQMVKDCGMNFIRATTYPRHPFYAQKCDELGILLWEEIPYWGIGGFKGDGYWTSSAYPPIESDQKPFEESCKESLREMIKINRNHASIFTWSMGNEVFFSEKKIMNKAKNLVVELNELSHELDSTRATSIGGAQREGFDVLVDVAGYNGDGATLYKKPGFPSIVSEYGSVVSNRPGKFSGNFEDLQKTEYNWRSGQCLWVAFHHGSIVPGLGRMGFVDYYRLPLNAYYWYRKEYKGIEPPKKTKKGEAKTISITADKTTIRNDGTHDAHIVVTLLNGNGQQIKAAPDVTLSIVEGNGLFPTGDTITFKKSNNAIFDGQCAIEFRSYYAGKVKIKASCGKCPDAFITIDVEGNEKYDGHHINPMTAPPTTDYMHTGNDIICINTSRPIFPSSQQSGFEASHLSDGIDCTKWMPDEKDKSPWVIFDLENFYFLQNIFVEFDGTDLPKFKVQYSVDKRKWKKIKGKKINGNAVTIDAKKASCRFVKISKLKHTAINSVKIYGNV